MNTDHESTSKLYLHIGYPKTGTTSVQQSLFWPLHNSNKLFYAGTKNSTDTELPTYEQSFLVSSLYDFVVENKTPNVEKLTGIFRKYPKILISREGITSALISCQQLKPSIQLSELVNRLRSFADFAAVDDVRIIVTFRRQDEMAHSLFAQGYRCGVGNEFMKFIERIRSDDETFTQGFEYANVLRCLISEFGENNVFALFYEELQLNPQKYKNDLLEIFEISGIETPSMTNANTRRVDAHTKFARSYGGADFVVAIKRLLFPRTSFGLYKYLRWLNIYKFKGRAIKFSPEDKTRLLQRYTQSNLELEKLVRKDLKIYHYY